MIIKGEDAPPVSKNQYSLERANHHFYEQEYTEALSIYENLLTQTGGINMHANVGYCLQKLDRHEEAVKHFETFMTEFPYRHHIWKAMAYSYYTMKDYEMMSRCAREAIKWDIDRNTIDDYSWQQMATAHFLLNDLSTALKAARKSIAINPHNAFAHYYLACIYYRLWQGDYVDQSEKLLPSDVSKTLIIESVAEALALHPELLQDIRDEKLIDDILLEDYFKLVDGWCHMAQLIKVGDLAQICEIWQDKLEEDLNPQDVQDVQESDSNKSQAQDEIDQKELWLSLGLDKLNLNSQMGTWNLWEVAARYEQNEIMQLRQKMNRFQQKNMKASESIDHKE
jgi:tetratricopeptide (TPR) repeat protein